MTPDSISGLATPAQARGEDRQLRELAEKLEASFVAEMLKLAGAGKAREAFGGGAGEDQFASLLMNEQATAIVEAGGLGLAESIYQSLVQNRDGGA